MLINRRGILVGLSSALAAPAIVHAQNLMPIKVFKDDFTYKLLPVNFFEDFHWIRVAIETHIPIHIELE